MKLSQSLYVFLPDTRAVEISRFGKGNLKIGPGVHSYSRPAGRPHIGGYSGDLVGNPTGTCPGSTPECEAICYAKRIIGAVRDNYERNTGTDVPELPVDCGLLRIHVSGDFDSVPYILNWRERLRQRPDVIAWAYTRSWRVPELLPSLEYLRTLPNVQVFASMDRSHSDEPPISWRRAWIDGDPRAGLPTNVAAHEDVTTRRNIMAADGVMSLVCPEETKHKRDCAECGYCFNGQKNDVTFLRH